MPGFGFPTFHLLLNATKMLLLPPPPPGAYGTKVPKVELEPVSPDLGIRSGGGGSPKGLVHNLLMQFVTVGSSKIEVFETCFSDIVTT